MSGRTEVCFCEFVVSVRFPCGRWLGKSVDDGSLERLLVAEPVSPETNPEGEDKTGVLEKCDNSNNNDLLVKIINQLLCRSLMMK